MIRFADDIAIIAESEDELLETLEKMKAIISNRYNMKINNKQE